MRDAELLRDKDLRAALRLANEARELSPGSLAQREHVLRGLARLTGAQVGIWGEVQAAPRFCFSPAFEFGWSGERERRTFLHYMAVEQFQLPDPSLPRLFAFEPHPVVTVSRQQLIADRDWYRSEHAQERRRAAGVDGFLYSGWLTAGRCPAFSLHRPWGDKPFSDRDRALVDAFHSESPWLHQAPPPRIDDPRRVSGPGVPPAAAAALLQELPPRLREVLSALARGHSEKQVAAELRLSRHTVHDYVKALHARLRVRSRGELLARVLGEVAPATCGRGASRPPRVGPLLDAHPEKTAKSTMPGEGER
jgi:DNA-binding CsgD family transcriptional regulator